MPTLVDFPSAEASVSRDRAQINDDDDASETMIFDDDTGSILSLSRQERMRAAIDESTLLLSPDTEKDGYGNGSNSLFDHMNHTNDDSILLTQPESKSTAARSYLDVHEKENERSFHNTSERVQTRKEYVQENQQCPNHDLYQRNYSAFVSRTISNFEAQHPGQLQDYRQMSADDKKDAQLNLMTLLGRLGISKGKNGGNEGTLSRASDSTMDQNDSTLLDAGRSPPPHFDPDETALTLSRTAKSKREVSFHQDVYLEKQHRSRTSDCSEDVDKSAMLLSPQGGDVDKSEMLLSPQSFQPYDTEHGNEDNDDHSFGVQNDETDESIQDSVEIPRAARASSPENLCYNSPEHIRINPHKRLASTSGKRGADISRQRLSQESTPPSLSGAIRGPDSDIELSSHVRRLSISSPGEPKDLFLASQSPIQPKSTYDSSDDELSSQSGDGSDVRRSHSFRHYARPRQSDVTVDTIDSYARKPNRGRAMREAPVGIKLLPGATFHLEKLSVKRTETMNAKKGPKERSKGSRVKRFINFPDPLVRYSKRHRRVLKDLFAWISDSEKESDGEDGGSPSSCVVFSLSEEKIVDLTLKVLLADAAMDDNRRRQECDSELGGKTIIVVRAKEDLSKWETALREGTGCSVLNHATLPLSERVRSSTAEKAIRYDVVLTTYDALKSPDVAIQVDDMGYAVAKQAAPSGREWFSSTSSNDAPRMCKQLSVLHRITFQRIIFSDALGRKSFLAKPGTTRAVAFNALRADSRVVFFTGLEDLEIPPLLALKKSDKRAVPALLSLLRLAGEGEDERDVLQECICDAEDMYDG
ncbi:unnamed protein product [Cylindrotheca closterium]|uniref:Uncharacterized protein n=1 Tax=Cylindrotheca closterium TaxID=2856 RepID=A0AAD2GBY2_9STRA|nr:unnamed protein product [Cylindrotheca closterium]